LAPTVEKTTMSLEDKLALLTEMMKKRDGKGKSKKE